MNNKLTANLMLFFIIGAGWVALDWAFNSTTEFTNILIISFFIVWNINQTEEGKK